METEIFRWTGIILWSCLLTVTACICVSATVVAPIWTFYRVKTLLWQWRYLAEVADGKWSQCDLTFVASVPYEMPCKPEEIIKWLRTIEERAKSVKTL